jgi:hypothetical protein
MKARATARATGRWWFFQGSLSPQESGWTPCHEGLFSHLPAIASDNLASLIAAEVVTLPESKQSSVLDYVMFIKHQVQSAKDGDVEWERIIANPQPRPKLEAFMKKALAEGSEPLDLSKL